MKAVDTNVLVRLLTDDDPDQALAAERWIDAALSAGESVFVPDVVLAELAWVLDRTYGLPRTHIADAISSVLRTPGITMRAPDEVVRALARYRGSKAGFSDFLIAEQVAAMGCSATATFDRTLWSESEFVRP